MPITLRIAMQIRYLVICLVTAYPLLVACSNDDGSNADDDGSDVVPIAFSSFSAEEPEVTTRATSALNRDFQVYGFKTAETYVQTVFNNYTVAYADGTAGKSEDNTNNYYYIGAAQGQTIKYWDLSAEKYQFFAFCPKEAATVTGTTLSGEQKMTATMSIDDAGTSDCLYTELKTVEKSDYRKVVQMEFLRPIAQVRYRFVIRDDVDKNSVKIEESSFAPANSEEKIYTGGEVRVTHSTTGTTLAINGTTELNAFTTPDTKGNYYSVLPVGSTPYGAFTLKALVSGVQKEATVPREYMQWQPNHRYTYVFQIIDNSMTIVFVDVLEDDWIYGGYTQDEQYHW